MRINNSPRHKNSHMSDQSIQDNQLEQIRQKHNRIHNLTGKIFIMFIIFNSILFAVLEILLMSNDITSALKKWKQDNQQLVDSIENYGDKSASSHFRLIQSQQSKIPIRNVHKLSSSNKFQQLPFCLFLIEQPGSQYKLSQIQQSIAALNYKNYIKIVVENTNLQSNLHPYSYARTYELLKKSKCPKNSLLMFVNQPILPSALTYLNQLFQTYNIWATFVKNQKQNTYELVCFYWRIYELLNVNDFDHRNKKYYSLKAGDTLGKSKEYASQVVTEVQMRGIMEMCAIHFKYVVRHNIFKQSDKLSYFNLNQQSPVISGRKVFKKLTKLSQDYPADVSQSLQYRYNYKTRQAQRQYRTFANLTEDQMDIAIERMQIPYLPQGHSIMALQKLEYQQSYNIQKYSQYRDQLPFCLTVMSRNNIEQGRYWKVLNTILQQKYQNYHIVFIDDFSTDNTLGQTIKYLKQHNFPQSRITLVRNKRQMFATYNIINAAYSYCKPDDIQMLVDGDDQLIGQYVFNVFNAVYQNNLRQYNRSLWYVYCNYKDNWYLYGRSSKVNNEEAHYKDGKRVQDLYIGAIRTWKLKVLYKIPLSYHQKKNGSWLDTVYDDALAHPLLQLSTKDRVEYIPQIMYQYNRGYGNNDDSSRSKIQYRNNVYKWVMGMKRLQVLTQQQFMNSRKNVQIQSVLNKDKGIFYQQVAY